MKTNLTITVDSEVKKSIQQLAKRMGSNVSVLTNMFYVSAINTGSVHYYDKVDNYGEKLYRDYQLADDDDKEDAFSIKSSNKISKENFNKELKSGLWS